MKYVFVYLADDLFRNIETLLEPTDNEDDPNLFIKRDSFKAKQKFNEKKIHRTAFSSQNQLGFKGSADYSNKGSSTPTHFDLSSMQTKDIIHAENSSSKTDETKLIKNMKQEFSDEKVNIIIIVHRFSGLRFTI